MKRFLKNLFRDLVTGPARGGKPASQRTILQAEGLEDRVVLSGASAVQYGSTLYVDVSPNTTVELYELNPTANRQIEVIGATGTPKFNINAIKAVDITVSGNDFVYVNDSDGMPFASGSTITLAGSGSNNSMALEGSRAFDTAEDYIVSGSASNYSYLAVDNLEFQLTSAINTVDDYIQLTGGPLYVVTPGQNVVLSSPYSSVQQLSGMGAGGGSILNYDSMNTVDLYETAAYATVTLDTASAAYLEKQFTVDTYGQGDAVVIAATPSSVSTGVQEFGSSSQVQLEGNSGSVSVTGNSSSTMGIARYSNTGGSTHGILANVQVSDMKSLALADNANVSTNETVKVTEKTISGTGLFGNNAAVVSYSGVQSVSFFSGQLTDSYTVEASSSSASFANPINIYDESSKAFSAHVDLDAKTHLNLSLYNETSKAGKLYIDAPGGKFENSNGVVDVFFDGVLSSQIDFQGFSIAEEHS